ncbi:sulfatase-like hydrolase/transferase [Pedobacter sp. SD-b]|uniref:Sulfatase-like hydrolase/transferase n=1 Tax=Pedobacter segetis TaxID=2793069 RepID=A0ABS1BHU0_9SPHI|nr:LTA synthase family protein [Pedobacter segetis]MBK0381926.1 sulfatase-like hydrolase/transferase [Pedobacter segetis]
MSFFQKIFAKRFGPVFLLYLIIISLAFITRTALLIKSAAGFDWTFINIIGVYFIGLFYDTVLAGYFCIPLVLYIWLVPNKLYKKQWHRFLLYSYFLIVTFLLLFNIVAEWVFWEEFSTRFNFIAVDYLVYTTEVIGNIWESYPVVKIIIVVFLIAIAAFFLIKNSIKASLKSNLRFGKRTLIAVPLLCIPILSWFFVGNKGKEFSDNQFAVELAGDGLYEFGAAFWNNELDYNKFYATIDQDKAFKIVRDLLGRDSVAFVDKANSIERKISYNGTEKRYNVVLISVESLSADYLGVYGNTQGLTPNLDSLGKNGLLFSNLYASGTRTVRGLEALSLSILPTPGQSIVKRPNNENLFTIGNLLKKRNYIPQFIYGGYGYFDNMNYFFGNNGYQVIDRTAITDKKDIHYENIWGVADEDLFTLSIKQLDKDYQSGNPFFTHIMTVSNHRPFTYPNGRIDIPSHTSQEGAVKYTDYAIGKFLREAASKPWFNNTIFVIVADHCASSAGKTELPAYRYHIPAIIYAPKIVKPQVYTKLTGQMDLVPTILGMLKVNYNSKFFGRDIFRVKPDEEWAFISTYEKLGFIRNGHLLVLSPQKKVQQFKIMPNTDQIPEKVDKKLKEEAIAFYQTASYLYKNHLYGK